MNAENHNNPTMSAFKTQNLRKTSKVAKDSFVNALQHVYCRFLVLRVLYM